MINTITGIEFASKKIAEVIISKELGDELHSKIQTKLDIYNVKRLKQGEFKSLTFKSKKINYKSFSMSDFKATTICPYNKVIYKKTRVYYPNELPFKFQAKITNEDIQNAINSEEFITFIKKNPVKINQITIMNIDTPQVTIKKDKIYFEVPINSILGDFKFKFHSSVAIQDNHLILKNISLNSKNKIIKNNTLSQITNEINPFKYQLNSFSGKYCKIYITNAKISDNIINTEGVFIINKNYNGEK
ncbi:hypothetical protein IJ182_03970 [bacterium]|nr:hypothetical protein [bacterium]